MIQIIALLYASSAGREGLQEFERQAIPILREHGGVLVSASSSSEHSDGPDEIHVIQFPALEYFHNYKNDERLLALSALRSQVIRKIDLYVTDQFYDYIP